MLLNSRYHNLKPEKKKYSEMQNLEFDDNRKVHRLLGNKKSIPLKIEIRLNRKNIIQNSY